LLFEQEVKLIEKEDSGLHSATGTTGKRLLRNIRYIDGDPRWAFELVRIGQLLGQANRGVCRPSARRTGLGWRL